MKYIESETRGNVAIVTLRRGKVNAINLDLVSQLAECFDTLRSDRSCRAVLLTGHDKFFSFGFDLPELVTYDRNRLREFLTRFIKLKSDLFIFPKPLVAAINGHATAGGCMLALTADYRIMTEDPAKMTLNEINLGVPVFAGTITMLSQAVGMRGAERFLQSGEMYTSSRACEIGLVDQLVPNDAVLNRAIEKAEQFGAKPPEAFHATKMLLRRGLIDEANTREPALIEQFMDCWFSDETQKILKSVEIRK